MGPPRIKSPLPPLPHIIFNNNQSNTTSNKTKIFVHIAGQPKILIHTKFFSSKLKALPAQPNPKSEIHNPNKKKTNTSVITSRFCLNS